jgi:hypothetical protein
MKPAGKNRRREPPRNHHTGGWGKTAKNIELYSSAYQIAWKQISRLQKRERPDISLRLHASIRLQVRKGATNPVVIASEALKALGENEPGTLKTQESQIGAAGSRPHPAEE